jgi:RNA polymerase sigma factor (sigma-70 family)
MQPADHQPQNYIPRYKQFLVAIFAESDLPSDPTQIKTITQKLLSVLSDREKEIAILRYGLIDCQPKTLQQIGDHFGVCRERIRQLERKIIRKLKHPSRRKIFAI